MFHASMYSYKQNALMAYFIVLNNDYHNEYFYKLKKKLFCPKFRCSDSLFLLSRFVAVNNEQVLQDYLEPLEPKS